MSRVPSLFFLAALSGCYSYTGVERVIDLQQHTATVTLRDLRGADLKEDFSQALSGLLLQSGLHDRYPRSTLARQDFQAASDRLDFQAVLGFDAPVDVGLHAWDRGGWRLCPSEEDLVITESNADARDAAGCVIWKKGRKVLRAVEARAAPPAGDSLLPAFVAWDAAGRPVEQPEDAPQAGP